MFWWCYVKARRGSCGSTFCIIPVGVDEHKVSHVDREVVASVLDEDWAAAPAPLKALGLLGQCLLDEPAAGAEAGERAMTAAAVVGDCREAAASTGPYDASLLVARAAVDDVSERLRRLEDDDLAAVDGERVALPRPRDLRHLLHRELVAYTGL